MDRTLGGDERRHFRETMAPLRDHTGRIIGVIGASTDITEQQRTQQQLTEAIGFRERMMGILGHDLRSPIGTITMASDLLLRRNDAPPAAREHMLRIRRSADRMKEMIDTLLDFTRVRFLGQVPISPVPTDLADISRATVDEMRVAWPDRPIDLEVHGDSHGEWDPARMSQTISNLVGNAITYGDREAPVRVCVDGDGPDVELKVHNDGDAHPDGVAAGAVRALPPRRHPRIARRKGWGWASTSSSRSCTRTTARSVSSRRRRPAPRSRCTCRVCTLEPPRGEWRPDRADERAGISMIFHVMELNRRSILSFDTWRHRASTVCCAGGRDGRRACHRGTACAACKRRRPSSRPR